jgi:hypothetical protein
MFVAVLTVGLLCAAPLAVGSSEPAPITPASVPVLFLHGVITSPTCSGENTGKTAAPMAGVLKANGIPGPVIGIDYYCGDSGGVSDLNAGGPSTTAYPTSNYSVQTSIERLSLDLMWFIYTRYSSTGFPVDIVAHSMGGLIARYGLEQVSARNPSFPPLVIIPKIVTISSPFDGVDVAPSPMTAAEYSKVWCGTYVECSEMVPGSPFLTALHADASPQGGGSGTSWTTLGGSPKDIMTDKSSSDVGHATHVCYYDKTKPGYGHSAYLTDVKTTHDLPVRYTAADGTVTTTTTGVHSLEAVAQALLQP